MKNWRALILPTIGVLLVSVVIAWGAGFDGNSLFFKDTTSGNTYTVTPPGAATTMVGTDTTQTLTNKTLTSPTITGSTLTTATLTTPVIPSIYQNTAKTQLMTLPDTTSDTLAAIAATQTLTNKTLTTPVIISMYQNTTKTQLMTLPDTASDTLAAIAATQTMTNKTLTTPVIISMYQDTGKTKLMTLPNTASDTLAALAATQAMSNKTISSSVFVRTIADKSTSYLVLSSDASGCLTNKGVTGAITFTLPEASTVIGKPFCFIVLSANTVDIDPDNADQIIPLTNSAGDRVENAGVLGSMIWLMAVDNTYWTQMSKEIGTWSDNN